MANSRIKFKVSIEKLTFEYEGDQERGAALHGRLTDTLGSLAGAQADAIDITPTRQLAATSTPPTTAKRRTRRRTPTTAVNTDGAPTAESNGTGSDEQQKAARKRKSRGTGYTAQVSSLLTEGYFGQKRKEEEVREELVRRGHNFEQKRVNEALLKLTQSKKLDRAMNATSEWEYQNGVPA